MSDDILRKVDVDWLLCVYGALLTDKQREIATLYYEEDYSLAEIAQQQNVSRQSVHDTLHRVEKQLRSWEEKLGFRGKLVDIESAIRQAAAALPENDSVTDSKKWMEKALCLLNDEEEVNGL